MGECASGDVRLFNPTAAVIWQGVERRLTESSIARAIARDFGVEYRIALADVGATLESWDASGLTTFDGRTRRRSARASEPGRAPPPAIEVRGYRLGAGDFRVRYRIAEDANAEQRRYLERVIAMFAPLEGASTHGGPLLDLAVADGYERGFGPFCRSIVDRVFGPFDWLFSMHAAALARGERAIALCASQGSGKSTLAAWLAARGWRYFSDDLAIVDPSGRAVLPLPVAVGVKEGSRAILQHEFPALDSAQLHRYGAKAARYLAMPRSAAATGPAPLAAIVFSRYEAGAAASLSRIPAADAAQRMMEAGIAFSPALRPAMIEWMGQFLRDTPCHQLRYSSLHEAETALSTIT